MIHRESGVYIATVYVQRHAGWFLRRTYGLFSVDPWFNLWYLSWLLLAAITFILFRVLAQIPMLSQVLYRSAGAIFTLAPLFFQYAGGEASESHLASVCWLGGAVVATITLNTDRKWAIAALVLLLHVVVWGFVPLIELGHALNESPWHYREWLPGYLGFPLVGASIWLACVRLVPPSRLN